MNSIFRVSFSRGHIVHLALQAFVFSIDTRLGNGLSSGITVLFLGFFRVVVDVDVPLRERYLDALLGESPVYFHIDLIEDLELILVVLDPELQAEVQ